MKRFYIGIDPGAKGGIAFIDMTQEPFAVGCAPFGREDLMQVCIRAAGSTNLQEVVCCLEKVGAMPGQGVVSMFSFGENVGYIKGVLEAFGIPYQEVSPRKWKNAFGLSSDKSSSAIVCQQLFPGVSLLPTARSRKPHDGMAEALLMAEYAKRNF